MLQAEGLRKEYVLPKGERLVAVADATFSIGAGSIYGLLGPNGAGKTTLLRMLATIITPTSGRCVVNGFGSDTSPDAIRRHIGFLSGNTKLYGRLTGRELLRFFGQLYGMDRKRIASRCDELIEALDLSRFVDQRCETLSTGQTQRISLARVMLHEPAVLILDEPTLGLDIMTSRALLEFMKTARDLGHTILFSTHHLTEAEQLCDTIGFIFDGRILREDSPAALCEAAGAPTLYEAFLAAVADHEAATV